MQKLTWQQVNVWRLTQQQLTDRTEPSALLAVVARLGGVQAQLMSAAELALRARVKGITPADIQRLLWEERQLVKTWAMRGTLHLLPSRLTTYGPATLDEFARWWGFDAAQARKLFKGMAGSMSNCYDAHPG